MLRDSFNRCHSVRCIVPLTGASDNTAQVSTIVDTANFTEVLFFICLGALADADATFTVLLEHADISDMTGAAAVPDEFLLGTEVAAAFRFDDDNEVRKLGYIGPKRYLRLTITPANNSGGWGVSATALLSGARSQPTDTLADD